MKQLLQQVRVVDPLAADKDRIADVLIDGDRLEAIDSQIDPPADAEVQTGKGLVLGPGLVDLYSQSGEPGFEARETLASLTQAALAGGFTRLSLLPTTQPCLDQPGILTQLQKFPSPIQLQFWGALTQEAVGEHMSELLELNHAGVVGFSDGRALSDWGLIRRMLEYLKPLGKPIALWPCDRTLAGEGTAREGSISLGLGLPGSPVMAETAALAALIECVREIGTPVHIMRLSTARGVELLSQAKDAGLPLTASVSWLHLLCDCRDLAGYDPNLRLDPPLGNPNDRLVLAQAVQAGVVDAIAIDHSPYTYEEKTVAFGLAPAGAIGLELALPLLWQQFVASGQWSATELWRAVSTTPAQCLGQTPPSLSSDAATEFILFDPQLRWVVTAEKLQSRASNTSWLGKEVCGQVLRTYLDKTYVEQGPN